MAEHILTGHKVAIKILNRRKIKQMDMEEKGDNSRPTWVLICASGVPAAHMCASYDSICDVKATVTA